MRSISPSYALLGCSTPGRQIFFVSQDVGWLQLLVPVDLASCAGVFTAYKASQVLAEPGFLVDLGRRPCGWGGGGVDLQEC